MLLLRHIIMASTMNVALWPTSVSVKIIPGKMLALDRSSVLCPA